VDPTDTKAAAAKLPPVDSLDMWPLISGQNSTSPRVDVPVSYDTLISEGYKILVGTVTGAGWTGPQYPNKTHPEGIRPTQKCGESGCLYNIKTDPNEHNNLAVAMPDILEMMHNKLEKYRATYFNPFRGFTSKEACDKAINKYGSFWGPFLD